MIFIWQTHQQERNRNVMNNNISLYGTTDPYLNLNFHILELTEELSS